MKFKKKLKNLKIPSDEHWYHYMQTTTTKMTTKRQPYNQLRQKRPLPMKIGGKEEAEPAGTMTSLLVCNKLPYVW